MKKKKVYFFIMMIVFIIIAVGIPQIGSYIIDKSNEPVEEMSSKFQERENMTTYKKTFKPQKVKIEKNNFVTNFIDKNILQRQRVKLEINEVELQTSLNYSHIEIVRNDSEYETTLFLEFRTDNLGKDYTQNELLTKMSDEIFFIDKALLKVNEEDIMYINQENFKKEITNINSETENKLVLNLISIILFVLIIYNINKRHKERHKENNN